MQHIFRRCAHYDSLSTRSLCQRQQNHSLHKNRNLSIFNKVIIGTPKLNSMSSSSSSKHYNQIQNDLDRAIKLVQKHDPVGYLPGLLVTKEARIGYFAGKLCVRGILHLVNECFSTKLLPSVLALLY